MNLRGKISLALAAVAAIAIAFAVVLTGGSKSGASPTERAALMRADCPEYEVVYAQPAYARERQRDAMEGRFKLLDRNQRLVPPVDWRRDPQGSRLWRAKLNRFSWLDPLLFRYRELGDRAALRRALDLVLDWRAAAARDEVHGEAWTNKVVGDRAPYLAYVTRAGACERMISAEEADLLLRMLHEHGRYLVTEPHPRNNHGLYMDFGLGLLAEQLPFAPQARRWRELAFSRFESTLRARTREGVWLEHSSAYQVEIVNLLTKFLRRVGRDAGLEELRASMSDWAGWTVMPDGRLTQVGDTNLVRPPEWALAEAADDSGLRARLRAGYAVVKDGSSYLQVGASYFNNTHKHADELSFQLYEGDERVVGDGGKYHGERDSARAFALSAPAHSTLTAGGRFVPSGRPYGSGLIAAGEGDGWYAILGKNPLLRGGENPTDHRRLFLYRPGSALVVVDRLTAARPQVYRRYFQLGPEIDLVREAPGRSRLRAPGLDGYLTDAPVSLEPAADRAVRGRTKPFMGLTFPAFRERVPRWVVRYAKSGRNLVHAATFSFEGRPLSARSSGRWQVVVGERGGTAAEVAVRRDGDRLAVTATG
jgi:hypothetical protein